MNIQLIDHNKEFQEANPNLKNFKIESYYSNHSEFVYRNDEMDLQISVIADERPPSKQYNGYNGIFRIGKDYHGFSRENEFQLTIPNASITVIRLILNTKSKIAPNLTNYEVYDRLQKIKNVGREEYPFPKICKSDLDYVEEFLLLENETFEKSLKLLVNNKLQALSNTLKNSYEQTEPLINELDNSLDIITKATKSIETVKTAADFVYNEMRCNQLLKEEVNRLNIELERANKTYDDLLLKNAELRKKLNSRK